MRGFGSVVGVMVAVAVSCASVHEAEAQVPPPSPQQKAAAARKFKEGERAFAVHDYRAAAQAFEEAYAIAPHPDTMFNAIDARERAGELALAAGLCDRVARDFPTPAVRGESSNLLAKYLPKLGRLDITLGPGAANVAVDGRPVQAGMTYVDPGDHAITATIQGAPFDRRITVVAGARETVQIVPGPPPPPPQTIIVRSKDEKPLHPAWFFVGAGLTTVSGALLVWSGVDTNAARSDFDANPTQQGLDDGKAKQLRTNVLIGTTAGLGAVTAALGIFAVEWSILAPDEAPRGPRIAPPGAPPPGVPARVSVVASPTFVALQGAF